MREKTYAGRITNNGSQRVEGLFKTESKVKPKVKKGGDLRTGGKK